MVDILVYLPVILSVMQLLAPIVMVLPTKYDYHWDLPERGPSGDMTGGEYTRVTDTGPFNSCNPRPIGEADLGSTY